MRCHGECCSGKTPQVVWRAVACGRLLFCWGEDGRRRRIRPVLARVLRGIRLSGGGMSRLSRGLLIEVRAVGLLELGLSLMLDR